MHSRDESMLACVLVGPALMCDNWFSLTPALYFVLPGMTHLLGELLNYFKRLVTIFLELLCIRICEV